MNFITDLPKRDPLVRYIVASAVTLDDDTPVYRMHAIILRKSDPGLFIGGEVESDQDIKHSLHGRVITESSKIKQSKNTVSYILCHVRKVNDDMSAMDRTAEKVTRLPIVEKFEENDITQLNVTLIELIKLRKRGTFKDMSFEAIKRMDILLDGRPMSNYLINKYILQDGDEPKTKGGRKPKVHRKRQK